MTSTAEPRARAALPEARTRILRLGQAAADEAECRLVCFPWAGGSSTLYRHWQDSLDTAALDAAGGPRCQVEVVPVELPGRMSGIRHEPLPSMSRLADDAALALLLSEFVRDRSVPYALFGFSFGAILAYEVCHRLCDKEFHAELSRERPVQLFVCAEPPPHMPPVRHTAPVASLSSAALKAYLMAKASGDPAVEALFQSEVFELFEPVIRADYQCLDGYSTRSVQQLQETHRLLPLPILAFGGSKDTVLLEELQQWQWHSAYPGVAGEHGESAVLLPGTHFFLEDAENLGCVQRLLLHDLTQRTMEKGLRVAAGAQARGDSGGVRVGLRPSSRQFSLTDASAIPAPALAVSASTTSESMWNNLLRTGTIEDVLYCACEAEQNAPALQVGHGSQTLSRAQLTRQIDLTARSLSSQAGIRDGDSVALMFSSCYGADMLVCLFALWRLGTCVLPLDADAFHEEIEFALLQVQPRVVLTDSAVRHAPVIERLASEVLKEYAVVVASAAIGLPGDGEVEGAGPDVCVTADTRSNPSRASQVTFYIERLESRGDSCRSHTANALGAEVTPETPALVLPTSRGTERSSPRFVCLQHQHVVSAVKRTLDGYPLTQGCKTILLAPLYQAQGLVGQVLTSLACYGAVVLPAISPSSLQGALGGPSVDLSQFWATVRSHGISWYSASPAIHHRIMDYEDSYVQWGSPALRFVAVSSAAVIPGPLVDLLRSTLNTDVVPVYCSTYAGGMEILTASLPRRSLADDVGAATYSVGIVARLSPDENDSASVVVRVLDEESREVLQATGPGRLRVVASTKTLSATWIQGTEGYSPCVSRTQDGEEGIEIDTGMTGYTDVDGYVYILGQRAPVICTENDIVSCAEVYSRLSDLPSLRAYKMLVLPVPAADHDQVACVVLSARSSEDESRIREAEDHVLLTDIQLHLESKGGLKPHWFPKGVVLIEDEAQFDLVKGLSSQSQTKAAQGLPIPLLEKNRAQLFRVRQTNLVDVGAELSSESCAPQLTARSESIGMEAMVESYALSLGRGSSTRSATVLSRQPSRLTSVGRTYSAETLLHVQDLVIAAMSDVLGLSASTKAGLDGRSQFFELGGGSIQIIPLVQRLNELCGVSLSEESVFLCPSVAELAQSIVEHMPAGDTGIRAESRKSREYVPEVSDTHLSVSSAPPIIPMGWTGAWLPLSFGQEQMYALYQQGHVTSYNMPYALRLSRPVSPGRPVDGGVVDSGLLRRALLMTIEHQESLRTVVRVNESSMQMEQRVLPVERSPECLAFRETEVSSEQEAWRLVTHEQGNHAFDLERGPQLHVLLIRWPHGSSREEDGNSASAPSCLLLVNTHHIGTDGWSLTEHRRQLLQAYARLLVAPSSKTEDVFPTRLAISYTDFSLWQRRWLIEQGEADRQLQYWKEHLADVEALDIPLDNPRPAVLSDRGGRVPLELSREIVKQMRDLLSAQGCTMFMGTITLFQMLLFRWSGNDQIVCGCATANRNYHPQLKDLIGQVANVVALRSDFSGRPCFSTALRRVKEGLLSAWRNQDVPWHHVVAALGTGRDLSRTPIFQAMFAYQELSWHSIDVDMPAPYALNIEIVRPDTGRCKFEIHLMLRESSDGSVQGDLLYADDLYQHATMERFAAHFVQLAASVVEEPSTGTVGTYSILSSKEVQLLQYEWNDTVSEDFPEHRRVEELFESAAAKYATNVAIEESYSLRTCSYAQLSWQSDQIAALLYERGARSGHRIGLFLDRSIELIATNLAIMKLGCIFVPVDASKTPSGRIAYMLKDSDAKLSVLHDQYRELLREVEGMAATTILLWSAIESSIKSGSDHQQLDRYQRYRAHLLATGASDVDSPVSIFYTSGTTGVPKGVLHSHRNIANLIGWWHRQIELNESDKFLQFSSNSFIMSLRQIWPTLTCGACLVLPTKVLDFGDTVHEHKVTKMALTPSALQTIDPVKCVSLKQVQVAGEAPTLQAARFWATRLDKFFVGLGPTELTAHACTGQFTPDMSSVNIGFPVCNTACYIVNKEMQLQPIGVVGELIVAGENVAQEYINQPELTNKAFIANPFDTGAHEGGPGKFPRMYRTGDLARRLPNGRVQFVGRRDAQVKIRGFRVEIAEVVVALLQNEAISRAEVLLKKDVLVAYVTPSLDEATKAKILDDLRKKLPSYMVPSFIVSIEAFPLTKNGKLDRTALPEPHAGKPKGERHVKSEDRVYPGTVSDSVRQDLVSLILGVWKSILRIPDDEALTAEVTFFDAGGTSLSAILMARQLGNALGLQVMAVDVFQYQTAAALAEVLQTRLPDKTLRSLGNHEASASATASVDRVVPVHADSTPFTARVKEVALPRFLFVTLQLAGMLYVITVLAFGPAILAVGTCLFLALERIGLIALLLFPPVLLGGSLLHCILAAVTKHIILGRIREGAYSVFGWTFLRWWLGRKILAVSRSYLWFANETFGLNWYYRVMGASIGEGVSIDEVLLEDPEMVTIGEGSVLDFQTAITPGEVLGEVLVIRKVRIGRDVHAEPKSVVLGGCSLPRGTLVTSCSVVHPDLKVSEPFHVLEGNPARILGRTVKGAVEEEVPVLATESRHLPSFCSGTAYSLLQCIGFYLLLLCNVACFAAALSIAVAVEDASGLYAAIAYAVVGFVVVMCAANLVLVACMKWILFLGKTSPGVVYEGRFFFLRRWFMDRLLLSPLQRMSTFIVLQDGTTYPWYMRLLLGIRVGDGAWINRPYLRSGCEHISVGKNVHSGMNNVWTTAVVHREGVEFRRITLGDECTLGQRVVLMPGCAAGHHLTLGAETALQDYHGLIEDDSTVFGCPIVVFRQAASDQENVRQLQEQVAAENGSADWSGAQQAQSRESAVQTALAPGEAQMPNVVLLASALFQLMVYPVLLAGYGGLYLLMFDYSLRHTVARSQWWLLLMIPAVYLAGTMVFAVILAALHRLGIFKFREGSTGFYTWRFFLWTFGVQYNDLFSGVLLSPFAGSWIYHLWLRMMGAKVAKSAVVMPHNGGFREIDGIALGEHTLCLTPFTHGHFIDHGALQFAPVAVGNGCTLNAGATVMPLSLVADGSTLQPHTVTVKGQQLHERGVYRGSVAEIRRHTAAQVVDAKMAQVEVTVPAEYLHRLEEHCRRPSGPAVGDASTR